MYFWVSNIPIILGSVLSYKLKIFFLATTCVGEKCKPSVVLLPIFTVEDAPADKLIHRKGYEVYYLHLLGMNVLTKEIEVPQH